MSGSRATWEREWSDAAGRLFMTTPTARPDDAAAAPTPGLPPGALPIAHRLARRLVRPVERFLAVEAASGILLIVAAVTALVWANSPWADSYHATWATRVGLAVGDRLATASVHLLVNDVLMSIFFLVVGLEIRRELHHGELADRRRAALPAIAAVGGMVVPAAIFVIANLGGGAAILGWGVPMATDIAFAVGVLTLLGKRVPPALRVLLLALAIIDDLGAILVIAIFYSSGIDGTGLSIALSAFVGFGILHAAGIRSIVPYLAVGAVLWIGVLMAGVHPTIAGVITGLMIPTQAWEGREEQSPAARLEHALHAWVAFAIMPVFALANAGVDLGGLDLGAAPGVAIGVAAGLVVGKPVGVVLACALAVRVGVAALPRGVTWRGVMVVGVVAGIGFTMALFIARLAFAEAPELHAIAKAGVLAASVIAALLAFVLGRAFLATTHAPGTADTADEAERSTEA
jgi:NhaA family Na+:H+ antiporter